MGEKPDQIADEIRDLRHEIAAIVDELGRRANVQHAAREAAGAVTQRAEAVAADVAGAMPEPVRRNPAVVGGAALGVLASVGLFTLSNLRRERELTPSELAALRARESLTRMRSLFGGVPARPAGERTLRGMVERGEPSMFKRLVWIGLVSVTGALGAMLFQRLTANFWRATFREEPPKK